MSKRPNLTTAVVLQQSSIDSESERQCFISTRFKQSSRLKSNAQDGDLDLDYAQALKIESGLANKMTLCKLFSLLFFFFFLSIIHDIDKHTKTLYNTQNTFKTSIVNIS